MSYKIIVTFSVPFLLSNQGLKEFLRKTFQHKYSNVISVSSTMSWSTALKGASIYCYFALLLGQNVRLPAFRFAKLLRPAHCPRLTLRRNSKSIEAPHICLKTQRCICGSWRKIARDGVIAHLINGRSCSIHNKQNSSFLFHNLSFERFHI